jgi:outer membrane lipoprotein-sorting protein
MRRLRTISTRRLYGIAAAVVLVAGMAVTAQAALRNSASPPPRKALDRAVLGALRAPQVAGVSARVKFTNGLLPAGSLPNSSGASPLAAGGDGRVWVASDGRFRVELQADRGDAQIVDDGHRVTIYDPASKTAYTLPSQTKQKPERSHEGAKPTLRDVDRALARLARTWNVSGARPTTTGNRPTYTVRIAPKDDGGLLGAAELAWDAAKGVPLRAAVYAQGNDKPVLELAAREVSFGPIASSTLKASLPKGTDVVEINPPSPAGARGQGKASHVHGAAAVGKQLGFALSAPKTLAGLPRTDVTLVRMRDGAGALSTYGSGMGAIAVFQHKASSSSSSSPGGASRDALKLPQINIDGATGTELATPLGTVLSFTRGGVDYVVVGSVPPVAAENAARGLR